MTASVGAQTLPYHTPVLLQEVLSLLLTKKDGVYVDGTLGGGGHAQAVLERLDRSGMLIGLDVDEDAIAAASRTLGRFGAQAKFKRNNFRDIKKALLDLGVETVTGILLDLGVSSHQLDEPSKGFSFRGNEKLDMRMDRTKPLDALQVVNEYDEQRLSEILWKYGEERNSRRIVKGIVRRRATATIQTTGDLATILQELVGERFLTKTLARVFQAIRIEVNNELENLKDALRDTMDVLQPQGRLVVISYHSLEDRIVKEAFRSAAATSIPSGHKLLPDTPLEPRMKVLTRKPVEASDIELRQNPRSRSAKLRAAEKL
ncbi:MAG: 16S rRNA (cytosine(1402)-N(4))-methyltransferase RsmH [Bacteroidota bacterium]